MKFNRRSHGIANGYRSGLEERVSKELDALSVSYEYEKHKIKYATPETKHTYTPDFKLSNGIYIETKGRFLAADRKKHLLIKKQHPELDIRFVFTNSRQTLSKKSKTTYGLWCSNNGFKFADKLIPLRWLNE